MSTGFHGTAKICGTPDFGIIDIDAEQVAKGLQAYLARGSQLTGVSVDDIDNSVHTAVTSPESATLVDLIKAGMRLFDAIVWISGNRPEEKKPTVDPGRNKADAPSMLDIARAVFYVYFFLLTQARYPQKGSAEVQPRVANFLKTIMGLTKDQGHYIDIICSFDPQKFNGAWIRYVKFDGLGQEAISRFGLGVAGYRLFGPFKTFSPKADLSSNLSNSFNFAKSVAKASPTWAIHPITRAPDVLTKRGNLNKNLGNLILEVFSDEDIEKMVAAKMLYKKPTFEPNYQNYREWDAADDISGEDKIFR